MQILAKNSKKLHKKYSLVGVELKYQTKPNLELFLAIYIFNLQIFTYPSQMITMLIYCKISTASWINFSQHTHFLDLNVNKSRRVLFG